MTHDALGVAAVVLVGVAAAALALDTIDGAGPGARWFHRYRRWWFSRVALDRFDPRVNRVPWLQAGFASGLVAFALLVGSALPLACAALVAVAPPVLLAHRGRRRREKLEGDLDTFLVALADALSTVPNLAEALGGLAEHTEPPIRDELRAMLAEVRLGASLDDALTGMAARLELPGLDAAVGAVLLGKRTGGDLPAILRRIAGTMREMRRLEGVVRTKTAEGRSQAWVMGAVPPGLVLALEQIDPDWLEPLWNDPIGWMMLGAAAILEVSAVALIRRIMAVDI